MTNRHRTSGTSIGIGRGIPAFVVTAWLACSGLVWAATTVNVEIDYMVDATHSHAPSNSEINAVVQMFAAHGITLHYAIDDAIPHTNVLSCTPPWSDDFFTCTDNGSFKWYKDQYFDSGPGWHYCIFAHDYDAGDGTGSSGIAQINGDDFVVSLGSFNGNIGTSWDRAATFAHEFGHNLGLTHAGSQGEGTYGKFKPNYISLMSYMYQLKGVRNKLLCLGLIDELAPIKNMDYSEGRMPSVDETALEESVGVGMRKVDWDCDGVLDGAPVAEDVSSGTNWCDHVGLKNTISDYNDWGKVRTNLGLTAKLSAQELRSRLPSSTITCMTIDQYRELETRALSHAFVNPANCNWADLVPTNEPAISAKMIFVDSSKASEGTGIGADPFRTVKKAHDNAPAHSVLYLQPGTYTNNGALLLTNRLFLAGPGGAVIDP